MLLKINMKMKKENLRNLKKDVLIQERDFSDSKILMKFLIIVVKIVWIKCQIILLKLKLEDYKLI